MASMQQSLSLHTSNTTPLTQDTLASQDGPGNGLCLVITHAAGQLLNQPIAAKLVEARLDWPRVSSAF